MAGGCLYLEIQREELEGEGENIPHDDHWDRDQYREEKFGHGRVPPELGVDGT